MKKHISIIIALLIASGNAFAFGALPLASKKAEADKLTAIMQTQKNEQDAKVDYITGVFLDNNLADKSFKKIEFSEKALNISFTEKNGSIIFSIIKTNKFDTADVNMQSNHKYGVSGDPHAPVELFAVITLVKNGKEVQTSKIAVVEVEALNLWSNSGVKYNNNSSVEKDAKGNCAKCGSNDPYHCGINHNGPCDTKTAVTVSKKAAGATADKLDHSNCADKYHCVHKGYIAPCQDTKVYDYKATEIAHKADCKDPYHCDCPAVGSTKAAAKVTITKIPTKIVTEKVTMHKADCVDQYHCDCPTKDVSLTVNKQLIDVKVHNADCKDKWHCDCPTEKVYE